MKETNKKRRAKQNWGETLTTKTRLLESRRRRRDVDDEEVHCGAALNGKRNKNDAPGHRVGNPAFHFSCPFAREIIFF